MKEKQIHKTSDLPQVFDSIERHLDHDCQVVLHTYSYQSNLAYVTFRNCSYDPITYQILLSVTDSFRQRFKLIRTIDIDPSNTTSHFTDLILRQPLRYFKHLMSKMYKIAEV